MKKFLKDSLKEKISSALNQLDIQASDKIQIDYARDPQHGDFACNIALLIGKSLGRNPRELAQEIVAHITDRSDIIDIQVAGAGFINFRLQPQSWQTILDEILKQKENYGRSSIGKGRKIHIEYVSSNPTGPLHVGHGRGAAYGSAVADLLTAIGCNIHREYYVNDAGRQMDILAVSVWLRYLELCGEKIIFPSNGYQGDYVITIAQDLFNQHKKTYQHSFQDIIKNTPDDETDKEAHIDQLIFNAKKLLGEENYLVIFNAGLNYILKDMQEDLAEFGVKYQEWFSEKSLEKTNALDRALKKLAPHLYQEDGATWFKTTDFGDDKDRVVIKENGQYTYFANDIAYHESKFDRGYTEVIDVLGADHHGYIPRIKAIIQALGFPVDKFHSPIVQFATLYRGKTRVPMSTRSGSFVTLRELREEVGNDAARYFYIARKADQHMDFDLELAKSQSNDNPVYYIQYAHARISSVFRQLAEKKLSGDPNIDHKEINLGLLTTDAEKNLLLTLSRYAEIITLAANQFEPHLLAHYLRDLADAFHHYYNAMPFLVTEEELRHARLYLVAATRQVLANGLQLLGVHAPETM